MKNYVQGQRGAVEAIQWTLMAPVGVDFTATTTRSLSVSVTMFRSGSVHTLSGWTITVLSATQLKAVYTPDGTEFPNAGEAIFRPTLTLDGTAYRYTPMPETIVPY